MVRKYPGPPWNSITLRGSRSSSPSTITYGVESPARKKALLPYDALSTPGSADRRATAASK